MSRRWFILVLSLVFLFLFRIWVNEVSTPERYRVGLIDSGSNHQLLIYPASSSSVQYETQNISTVSAIRRSDESRYIEMLENSHELLYIFPIFPDSLPYMNYDELVDRDSRMYPNHFFRFAGYSPVGSEPAVQEE